MPQDFLHASFEGIKSTDAALRLLRQFRSVLQRDSLRADLDAMYFVSHSTSVARHLDNIPCPLLYASLKMLYSQV